MGGDESDIIYNNPTVFTSLFAKGISFTFYKGTITEPSRNY